MMLVMIDGESLNPTVVATDVQRWARCESSLASLDHGDIMFLISPPVQGNSVPTKSTITWCVIATFLMSGTLLAEDCVDCSGGNPSLWIAAEDCVAESHWLHRLGADVVLTCHDLCECKLDCEQSLYGRWSSTLPGEILKNHHAHNRLASRPLECCLVNWRHNSMYLNGCIPDGYDLWWFIQEVPNVEFHGSPLCPSGAQEPGGSEVEATQIDGDSHKPLREVSLNISPSAGSLPTDRAAQAFATAPQRTHLPGTERSGTATTVHWQASLLNHQPLYFADVNLERHGFSHGCWQPVVSGAKFFATFPALPYLMAAEPPHCIEYSLGETKPGSCADYVHELPPVDLHAEAVEASVITGLIFLIP